MDSRTALLYVLAILCVVGCLVYQQGQSRRLGETVEGLYVEVRTASYDKALQSEYAGRFSALHQTKYSDGRLKTHWLDTLDALRSDFSSNEIQYHFLERRVSTAELPTTRSHRVEGIISVTDFPVELNFKARHALELSKLLKAVPAYIDSPVNNRECRISRTENGLQAQCLYSFFVVRSSTKVINQMGDHGSAGLSGAQR